MEHNIDWSGETPISDDQLTINLSEAEAEAEAVERGEQQPAMTAAQAVQVLIDARLGEVLGPVEQFVMGLHDRITKLEGQVELLVRMVRGTQTTPKPKPKP